MKKKTIILLIMLVCAGICFGVAVTSSPWDGTGWNVAAPNDEALVGNTYKEIQDLRKGVGIRLDKEHVTVASSSAGGEHKQGSARAFFQDAAPTTQIDGSAWVAGDKGSLWFDTNASPDNLVYVLTDHASTGTWTLLSVSMTAEIVAAVHAWADVQTFDVQTVHTLGLLSNADITLGAGDDLVGSATSDILINTNKFTVAGATGNTLVGGTFDIQGTTAVVGVLDEDNMASDSATNLITQQSAKAYVDAYIYLRDGKSGGTDGGTATSGSWEKRTITEEKDVGNHVTVSSSVIVLDAGTYQCRISAPAYKVDGHQIRLRNTTAGSTLVIGTIEHTSAADTVATRSFMVDIFTIAGSQNLEIQHRVETTNADDGHGNGVSLGETNIYTIAEFWKR